MTVCGLGTVPKGLGTVSKGLGAVSKGLGTVSKGLGLVSMRLLATPRAAIDPIARVPTASRPRLAPSTC